MLIPAVRPVCPFMAETVKIGKEEAKLKFICLITHIGKWLVSFRRYMLKFDFIFGNAQLDGRMPARNSLAPASAADNKLHPLLQIWPPACRRSASEPYNVSRQKIFLAFVDIIHGSTSVLSTFRHRSCPHYIHVNCNRRINRQQTIIPVHNLIFKDQLHWNWCFQMKRTLKARWPTPMPSSIQDWYCMSFHEHFGKRLLPTDWSFYRKQVRPKGTRMLRNRLKSRKVSGKSEVPSFLQELYTKRSNLQGPSMNPCAGFVTVWENWEKW